MSSIRESAFQHDLFISYAHIDNHPLGGRAQGWIADLHDALDYRLAMLMGRNVLIWRDLKLGGADFFDDEILDNLTASAAMLAIISPRYVRSDYCQKEVAAFLEHAQRSDGLRVGNKSRLIKAIKTPVPLGDMPDAIRGQLGFDFFEHRPGGGHQAFDELFGDEWKHKFWQKLEDLAQELAELLQLMREQAPSETTADGLTIYLGQATYDLSDARDSLRRELEQHGHIVVPRQQLSSVDPQLRTQIRDELVQANLAVHLIGEHYGMVPEAAEKSIQEIELELTADASRANHLPRIIWLAPDANEADTRQAPFRRSLQTEPERQVGADLLETPLEELKTVLRDRMVRIQQPAESAPEATTGHDLTRIYLVYDEPDEESVLPIEDHLYSVNQDIDILRPLFGDKPEEVWAEHEENLRICQAALIYYGQSDEAWLRTKMRDLRKAPGLGRTAPINATGIYIAPPLNQRKVRFRSREVTTVIHAENGFDPASLNGFLGQFMGGAA